METEPRLDLTIKEFNSVFQPKEFNSLFQPNEETDRQLLNITNDLLNRELGGDKNNRSFQIATDDDLTRFKSIFPDAFKELYSMVKVQRRKSIIGGVGTDDSIISSPANVSLPQMGGGETSFAQLVSPDITPTKTVKPVCIDELISIEPTPKVTPREFTVTPNSEHSMRLTAPPSSHQIGSRPDPSQPDFDNREFILDGYQQFQQEFPESFSELYLLEHRILNEQLFEKFPPLMHYQHGFLTEAQKAMELSLDTFSTHRIFAKFQTKKD